MQAEHKPLRDLDSGREIVRVQIIHLALAAWGLSSWILFNGMYSGTDACVVWEVS